MCVFQIQDFNTSREKKNDCVLLIFKNSFSTVRVMMAETYLDTKSIDTLGDKKYRQFNSYV